MLLNKPNLVILDAETTGLLSKDPDTRLVQVSLMNRRGKIIFSSLINPERRIPPDSTRVHGITDEDVALAPTLEEISGILENFLKGSHVAAYNAGFDIHLLTHLIGRKLQLEGVSCVMEMYQDYLKSKKWKPLPNLSGRVSHDSCNDCYNTWLLLKKIELGESPDEVISLEF